MPSVEKFLDTVTNSSFFGDVDTDAIFHNYKLSEKAQPYAGVDVLWDEKGKELRWERWTRMDMGVLFYQFATTSMFECGMEVIIGDRKYEVNTFYWDQVV